MTTREAAGELDVVPATVTSLIRQGKLQATLRSRPKGGGQMWWVNGASVRKLRKQRQRAGR